MVTRAIKTAAAILQTVILEFPANASYTATEMVVVNSTREFSFAGYLAIS
jgi:hypothetical protein